MTFSLQSGALLAKCDCAKGICMRRMNDIHCFTKKPGSLKQFANFCYASAHELTIFDFEIDLLVQHSIRFLQSALICPCVGPLQPLYGHVEGSTPSADLHAVSSLWRDSQTLLLSLNQDVFSGAVSFAEVHVGEFRAVGGARTEDGDLSSNMAAHLQHSWSLSTHTCIMEQKAFVTWWWYLHNCSWMKLNCLTGQHIKINNTQ